MIKRDIVMEKAILSLRLVAKLERWQNRNNAGDRTQSPCQSMPVCSSGFQTPERDNQNNRLYGRIMVYFLAIGTQQTYAT